VPTVPGGSKALIVNGAGADTTTDNGSELVCAGVLESLTVIVKLVVPVAVGLPEMMPLAGLRVRPAGRLPVTDQVYGAVPPVALRAPL
jgi:hypothetical protein